MPITDSVYEKLGLFYLGRRSDQSDVPVLYDSRDLLTHAVCVGMTGSGKTGLGVGILEEALMDRVPAIVVDPKGDMGNLLLTFPKLEAASFEHWVDEDEARREGITKSQLAQKEADKWKRGLQSWGQDEARIQRFREQGDVVIYTPGSTAGRPLSVLSSLNAPTGFELDDYESFAAKVEGTAGSLLSLIGEDADPLSSPVHTFLSAILTHRWRAGEDATLATIIRDLARPPFAQIGVMPADDVLNASKRTSVANKLNGLVAAPSFQGWLAGDPLEIDALLYDESGRPQISILSIAHLSEREKMFFTSLLLNRLEGWMRQQRGTSSLRALLYMDEIAGLVPPVAKPPTKKPIMTMMKQARAYGLGLVLATQNPGDIDYKALSNAGTWFIGRLQTDRDREKVAQGLKEASGRGLDDMLSALEPRQFLLHNVHDEAPLLFQTRWVMSYLKGPLTMGDIRELTEGYQAPEPEKVTAEPEAKRAVLPDDVKEYFLDVAMPKPEGATLLWRPMLYGSGTVHFNDNKLDLNDDVDFGFIVGFTDGPDPVDWSTSFTTILDTSKFEETAEDGSFMALPSPAFESKSYTAWKKELHNHAYREVNYTLLECAELKLTSTPGESERAFRARIADQIRVRRDDDLDDVRERYNKKISRVETKIYKLQDKLEVQQQQASDAKTDTLLSVGGGLLSALTGRSSRSAMRRSASGVRRANKEAQDVERAQRQLQDAYDELREIQQESEAELARVAETHSPEAYPIDTKSVTPRKSDVDVDLMVLVWVPYWVGPDGTKTRAM